MSPQRFKPYPAYKDSGVEWLGEIPAHWEMKRLKHLARIASGFAPPESYDKSIGEYPVYGSNGLIGYCDEYLVSQEMLAVGRVGASGAVNVVPARSWVSDNALIMRDLRPTARLPWLCFVLETMNLGTQAAKNAQPIITGTFLGAQALAAPPEPEQRAIVAFLDRETARIDALVAKKERLIELLQEKRTALINRVVTKGLDPNVPMKDSGVEWLGEIPAHWEIRKVAWLFTVGSGTTPRSEDPAYYGGDVPWITTSELRESVVTSTEKYVTQEALRDYPSLRVHPEGSVAVAMYGATIGRLGILGVAATVNQACCVFSCPRGINAPYWFYWLQMRRPYLVSLGYGGGQPNLSQELLRSVRVPTPPLVEQGNIVSYLDRQTIKINAMGARVSDAIGHLKELRTALVTAAVTGKIDVREEAA